MENVKKKFNWKKLFGLLMVLMTFFSCYVFLKYSSEEISLILSGKINFYWWEQIFKNGKLNNIQYFAYTYLITIFYYFIYCSFFFLILWSIIEKNKSLLSLSVFILFTQISLIISNTFLLLKIYTDNQLLFTILHKLSVLLILFLFIYQVFSKFWKIQKINTDFKVN